MRLFGLIGFPLSHSFSKKYFTDKFSKESIKDAKYELFEIDDISQLSKVLNENENLRGLNVTIPYKQKIIPYLDDIDPYAKDIGAVNVVKISDGKLKGYNSDFYGFRTSLQEFINKDIALSSLNALVLGYGGASKAIIAALKSLEIDFKIVSRTKKSNEVITYNELEADIISSHQLIINTTPLGMYPKVNEAPNINYKALTKNHYLYDLVYNPEQTEFMKLGITEGAHGLNGLPMLILQAEKSWDIWNGKE